MKFGSVDLNEAEGAILAHTARFDGGAVKKGAVLGASEIAALRAAGVARVTAARLESGDIHEDEAARRIAAAVAGPGVRADDAFTGRVNLFAESAGVFMYNAEVLKSLNMIDESVTAAALAPYTRAAAGQMTATVKIIPFAAPAAAVESVLARVFQKPVLFSVAPFNFVRAAAIITRAGGEKESVIQKRRAAVTERVTGLGGEIICEDVCAHKTEAVAAAVRRAAENSPDLIVVFGAAAVCDRRDVIPAGLTAAGGAVERIGMPADPGNLLLLGWLGETRVVGAPSCAASPKLNGLDWVLERLFAGLPAGAEEFAAMSVGGLLIENPTRPQPRRQAQNSGGRRKTVTAVVLAAGRSHRMGTARFKLTEILNGAPVVRRVCETALKSRADEVLAVTGFRADDVRAALSGLNIKFAHNPDFAAGLSSSLRTGAAALDKKADACLVCLGDMPMVRAKTVNTLIEAFQAAEGPVICAPVCGGKRGNPVLWSSHFFEALTDMQGDKGARSLMAEHASYVIETDVDDQGVLIDIDTPEALTALEKDG